MYEAIAGALLMAWVGSVAAGPPASPPPSLVTAPAPGVFLVARRELTSPSFAESVVLIVRHDEEGTLGVIVNRRTRFRLNELLPELDRKRAAGHPVYVGGPVAMQTLVMLMRNEKPAPGLDPVAPGLVFSAERKVLEELLARRKPAADLRLYIGYAGWAAGQLDSELARGAWLLVKAPVDSVFGDDVEGIWDRLINKFDPPGIRVRLPSPLHQAATGLPGDRSRMKAASAAARSLARSSTGAG